MIDTMQKAVVRAGSAVIRYKKTLTVEAKGGGPEKDIVTSADLLTEELLIKQLSIRFPDYEIISEETNTNNDKVPQTGFVIDPIDGTINFAHGIPFWGVQIAVVEDGKVRASAINLPEVERVYCADDSGAYLNDKRIHVSSTPLSESPYSIEGVNRIIGRKELIKSGHPHLREIYSTSTSFALVAQGALAASVHVGNHPWDYLPGEYLVLRAGGFSYNNERLHVVANTKESLDTMVEVFSKYDECKFHK